MHLPFFCPICNAPISHEDKICKDCAKQLDSECFDSMISRCPICFFPRLSDDYVCEKCGNGTRSHYRIYPVARYDGKLGYSVLYSFKFMDHRELAIVAAKYLKRALDVLDPEGKALIVPVPCSMERLEKYGWDHMIEVCKALKRPYLSLISNGDAAIHQQKRLKRTERILASYCKYAINPEYADKVEELRDRKVIVVDDILTTGSTMLSAIGLLEKSGFTDLSGATWLCEL